MLQQMLHNTSCSVLNRKLAASSKMLNLSRLCVHRCKYSLCLFNQGSTLRAFLLVVSHLALSARQRVQTGWGGERTIPKSWFIWDAHSCSYWNLIEVHHAGELVCFYMVPCSIFTVLFFFPTKLSVSSSATLRWCSFFYAVLTTLMKSAG